MFEPSTGLRWVDAILGQPHSLQGGQCWLQTLPRLIHDHIFGILAAQPGPYGRQNIWNIVMY